MVCAGNKFAGRPNLEFLPKAVIFDWDGTLVNTIPTLFESHNHVRKKLDVPLWNMNEYKQVIHRSTREIYPELYGGDSNRAIDMLYDYYHRNHLKKLDLFEGAEDLINYLYLSEIPLSIVSNKKQLYLDREICHLGWEDQFQVVIGAGTASKDKPHAEPLFLAISKMGLKPSEKILYVGDAKN